MTTIHMPLLSMQHIDKFFFGKPANNDISLEVRAGEIHALLGENGAGKSTLMNILFGIYSLDGGTIYLKGKEVKFFSPREAIKSGIGMVHQHFMLVPTLTVSENITLGIKSTGHPLPDRKKINDNIRQLSHKYGLDVDPCALVSKLSVGEEQRVEIIKLLYRDVELLILDEPTAVLTPQEIERFFSVLKRLKEEGHSIILITHRIPEAMAISDRVTVLRNGTRIATVNTTETNKEELSRLMIGRNLKPIVRGARAKATEKDNPRLDVKELDYLEYGQGKLQKVSFSLYPGEILGIAGVDGNGQKELAECILGLRKATQGTISLNGVRIEKSSVAERKKLGLAYVSDDQHHDGLVMDMNLVENYLLRVHTYKDYIKNGLIDYQACSRVTEEAISAYNIKAPGINAPVRLLSGGNQQKLILARELTGNPSVIVALKPTRGLDIGAVEFVQKQLIERRNEGCSVLLISVDLEEILMLSDRIGVMNRGRVIEILDNNEGIDLAHIGLMMTGHTFEEKS